MRFYAGHGHNWPDRANLLDFNAQDLISSPKRDARRNTLNIDEKVPVIRDFLIHRVNVNGLASGARADR